MSFEFRAGRKRVVKSVETVAEANELMRRMIAIRNENSLWENIDVKTGHLRAVDELKNWWEPSLMCLTLCPFI